MLRYAARVPESARAVVVSLLLTWLLFIEYIPPTKLVYLWSDIEGYHYPLLNYTHKSLRDGRFPLWDSSIYSGMSFAANMQAGLFYPPNWILYVVHAGRDGLLYNSVEILAIAHVGLAALLAYLWLRARATHAVAAAAAAGVVAYSGYLLSQLSHLGVASGYAWIPLGLWGIDAASRSRSWRPLWKLAVASAMCLLAGYPATWIAFSIVVLLYAVTLPGHLRLTAQSAAALALSLLLAAVQFLPTLEATRLKMPEPVYGGLASHEVFWSFLVPNYYDQNRLTRGPDLPRGDYLYAGAAALFALIYALRRRPLKGSLTAITLLSAFYLLAMNPGRVPGRIVNAFPVLPDVLRSYNLLLAFPLTAGLLTLHALDAHLSRPAKGVRATHLTILWFVATLAWSAWLCYVGARGSVDFPTGLWSGLYAAVLAVLLWLGLFLYRATRSKFVAAVLLLSLFVEYDAFGTNRRFNAISGNSDHFFVGDARTGGPSLRGLTDPVYHILLKEPAYRIAIVTGPHATDMRHYRLTTPQGFDPFLTQQYRETVEQFVPFQTNRLFTVQPANTAFFDHFGVGFVVVQAGTTPASLLSGDSRFELIQPADSFYQVFRYREARPAWRFSGRAEVTEWTPERRAFRVKGDKPEQFALLEQFWPGWRARVDGEPEPIKRCRGTFQCITVSPGAHTVSFTYEPASFYAGAVVSGAAWSLLVIAAWTHRQRSRGHRQRLSAKNALEA